MILPALGWRALNRIAAIALGNPIRAAAIGSVLIVLGARFMGAWFFALVIAGAVAERVWCAVQMRGGQHR